MGPEPNQQVTDSAKVGDKLSVRQLLNSIGDLNREIERIKGLKRYMLYEAGVEFVTNNKALVTSAFVASTLGLAGSLTGCLSAVAVGTAAQIAKKKGKLRTGKSISRLGRKIHRDLQPNIDKIIARYVGAEVPAIHILSIRKALSDEK